MCLVLFNMTLRGGYHGHLHLDEKTKAQRGSGMVLSRSHGRLWLRSFGMRCWKAMQGAAGKQGGRVTVKSEKAAWRKMHLS